MMDAWENLFPSNNPVFSGGFGLAVLAVGAQFLRNGGTIGISLVRRYFLVTLEVTSKDKSYPWVLQWLYSRGNMTQHLSVETSMQASKNASNVKIDFVPGPGRHFLNYNGRFMVVQRIREQQMVDLNSGKPWEKIQFTTYGRCNKVFQEILSESYELCSQQEEGKTIIFTNWGSEWRQFGQPRNKRAINSVILDRGVSEKLLADVNEWIDSSKWYLDRGIPYRRGYLLHGPPGSGKSSFIMALAGSLGYNICILNLAERGLTDDRLALALSAIPPQSLVLLEDIDAAFPSRESHGPSGDSSQFASSPSNSYGSDVTFSGLLNVLDGVASSEERLVFMTTNYIDRLDRALIRPGRVDVVQLLGDASDYQVAELFRKFYQTADDSQVQVFATTLARVMPKISMATLQGFLLRHKDDPRAAIEALPMLASELTTSDRLLEAASPAEKDKLEQETIQSLQGVSVVKRRPVKRLTAAEVDKMYFNPQEGWDKGIREL